MEATHALPLFCGLARVLFAPSGKSSGHWRVVSKVGLLPMVEAAVVVEEEDGEDEKLTKPPSPRNISRSVRGNAEVSAGFLRWYTSNSTEAGSRTFCGMYRQGNWAMHHDDGCKRMMK